MNDLRWPKRYATIRQQDNRNNSDMLIIKFDDGETSSIRSCWGCGGVGQRFVKGARIKVYQRDNVSHVNFRMVGR